MSDEDKENIALPPRKRTKYDIQRERINNLQNNRNEKKQIANKQTVPQQQFIQLRKYYGNNTGNTRGEGEIKIIIQNT